jgi:hypothetical protein
MQKKEQKKVQWTEGTAPEGSCLGLTCPVLSYHGLYGLSLEREEIQRRTTSQSGICLRRLKDFACEDRQIGPWGRGIAPQRYEQAAWARREDPGTQMRSKADWEGWLDRPPGYCQVQRLAGGQKVKKEEVGKQCPEVEGPQAGLASRPQRPAVVAAAACPHERPVGPAWSSKE